MAKTLSPLYLGIDVGGTKIQASVVEQTGMVLYRLRTTTPRGETTPEQTVAAIVEAARVSLDQTAAEHRIATNRLLAGIGVAIPGVVDPDRGLVVMTPNMNLTGVSIGAAIEREFGVPVAIGNDCNLGAMGEAWLGSARGTSSSVAILVGTGVGSGVIQHGKLWRGARESAGEIGHIVMQIGGPTCGCGNQGCLEALASRSAIERDIRAAVQSGEPTILQELLGGDLSLIRSGALRKALDANDEVVTRVVRRASEVLGYGCLTVRHLIDPEIILFGGGVIEACGSTIIPIVRGIIESDRLAGARPGFGVAVAALGDDAVVLGAVALVRQKIGRNPFSSKEPVPRMPPVVADTFGSLQVGKKDYDRDVIIRVNGRIKKRKIEEIKTRYGSSHVVDVDEMTRVCKGGPEIVFIGVGHSGQLRLTEEAEEYLTMRRIDFELLTTPDAAEAYNQCTRRKAAILHATC